MPTLITERIKKLRKEIAQMREAEREYMKKHYKPADEAAAHERRLQRLQEILDELASLTDWKKA